MTSKIINNFLTSLNLTESSLSMYKCGICKFIQYLFEKGIKNPENDNIIAFKEKLLNEGYKPGTVSIYLSSLRRFFAWCENKGIYNDITHGVKSPHVDIYHKRDAFSAQQLKQIIGKMKQRTLHEKRDYAVFILMATTGLRTCEIIRANIADMHRVAGTVILNIQGKGHADKDAFVKIAPDVEKIIKEYLNERGYVADDEPLFASLSNRNAGGRMTTKSISRICKNAMIHAGFDSHRLTAHSLRHSAVTLALLAGADLGDVKTFARHKDMASTLIYAHNFHNENDVNELSLHCEELISEAILQETETISSNKAEDMTTICNRRVNEEGDK